MNTKKNNSILEPWNIKLLSQPEFDNLDSNRVAQLKYFAHFGLLAPTSHNTVPQRFRLHSKTYSIDILLDKKSVLPYSDVEGRQAIISIGCVIKNIELAAEHYGYGCKIELHNFTKEDILPNNTSTQYIQIATLSFTPNKRKPIIDFLQTMKDRKVVRAEYDETVKLPLKLVTELQKCIKEDYSSIEMILMQDKLRLYSLAKFQEVADRTVFEQDTFAYELGEWLLPNDDTEKTVGMRGKEFGFDDEFAQRVHLGLIRKEKLYPDEIAAFAMGGKIGIKNSSAVIVLTVEHDTPDEWVEAGRAYEKLALILQQHGFVNAMHAGITEVKIISRMFSAGLGTRRKPVVVCRIGKPLKKLDLERAHSARPALEEIILED